MSRRIQVLSGVLAVCISIIAGACVDLSDQLENQPCEVEKDCAPQQDCAQTPDEKLLDLPGVCAPKGTACILGKQLGCSCAMTDQTTDCSSFALQPFEVFFPIYPRMTCEPTTLTCVMAPPEEMMP